MLDRRVVPRNLQGLSFKKAKMNVSVDFFMGLRRGGSELEAVLDPMAGMEEVSDEGVSLKLQGKTPALILVSQRSQSRGNLLEDFNGMGLIESFLKASLC